MLFSDYPKQSGIYLIRCLANNRVYVGSACNIKKRLKVHHNALKRGDHHSVTLRRAWAKYGAQEFAWEVQELVPNLDELIAREQYWINEFDAANPLKGFNMSPTAGSTRGIPVSAETRARLSESHKGKTHTQEWRDKMSLIMKGRKPSPQTIAASIKAHTGRKASPETRAKLSESHKNPSDETRAKMSAASKRRKRSPEHIAALHAGARRTNAYWAGKHRSEETKAKISRTLKEMKLVRSPETRAKMSSAKIGHVVSEETLRKMAATRKARASCHSLPPTEFCDQNID